MHIIQQVREYICSNLREPLKVDALADSVYYSSRHLNRIFELYMGTTLKSYCHWVRLSHAVYELRLTQKTIREIASSHGYACERSFSRQFKEVFACSPSQYRSGKADLGCSNRMPLADVVSGASWGKLSEGEELLPKELFLYPQQGYAFFCQSPRARVQVGEDGSFVLDYIPDKDGFVDLAFRITRSQLQNTPWLGLRLKSSATVASVFAYVCYQTTKPMLYILPPTELGDHGQTEIRCQLEKFFANQWEEGKEEIIVGVSIFPSAQNPDPLTVHRLWLFQEDMA